MERVAKQVRQLDRQEGRATMSFYLTLPSHKSTAYPDNTANSFQVQLPRQIKLDDEESGQWQVALSAISLPDATPQVSKMVKFENTSLFVVGWMSEGVGVPIGNNTKDRKKFFKVDAFNRAAPKNGVDLCKTIISFCNNARVFADMTDVYRKNRTFVRNNLLLYPDLKMEGDDLLLDYSKVDPKAVSTFLHFDEGFAAAMKWIEYAADGSARLGPNIQVIANKTTDLDKDSALLKDVTRGVSKDGVYWTVWHGWFMPSKHVSWRFVNVQQAYREMTNYNSRSLFVYCNVGESQVVGNKITDVLREVPYETRGSGHQYIEPRHLEYKTVRTNVLDIIEVQVAETDGKLTEFEEGTTTVTLHFKKTT